jgi:hypothetical protein
MVPAYGAPNATLFTGPEQRLRSFALLYPPYSMPPLFQYTRRGAKQGAPLVGGGFETPLFIY